MCWDTRADEAVFGAGFRLRYPFIPAGRGNCRLVVFEVLPMRPGFSHCALASPASGGEKGKKWMPQPTTRAGRICNKKGNRKDQSPGMALGHVRYNTQPTTTYWDEATHRVPYVIQYAKMAPMMILIDSSTNNDPLLLGGAISEIYKGAPMGKVPTPIPPMNRPATRVS